MRADYQIDRHVRLLRCAGWLICALLGLAVVLAMAWKIAQVSEQRALQATREHLAASLNSLAAEHLARHRELGAQWRKTNPFVLLRWEQDNYCGELPAGQAPQSACWYWLPSRAWVLYRARFADGWARGQGEVRAWRVLVVPAELSTASQSGHGAFALELDPVPAAQVSAAGY